jgi:hypothetical protein
METSVPLDTCSQTDRVIGVQFAQTPPLTAGLRFVITLREVTTVSSVRSSTLWPCSVCFRSAPEAPLVQMLRLKRHVEFEKAPQKNWMSVAALLDNSS